jgi:hypothetical protein
MLFPRGFLSDERSPSRTSTSDCIGTSATLLWNCPSIQMRDSAEDGVEGSPRRLLPTRNRPAPIARGLILMLGIAGPALAQGNGVQQPSARQQLQHIHTPQSIDQELARLVKDLELTRGQQQQVRPLLEEHHDKIQVLLDKNPAASRQELGPQIHAISDETHRKIHALLSAHQKELEKAMRQREHNGGEKRRSSPPAPAPSPSPS